MIRLHNVRIDINDKRELIDILANKLKIDKSDIKTFKIHKKSIDARNKMYFSYVYDFDFSLDNEGIFINNTKLKNINIIDNEDYIIPNYGTIPLNKRPIVVGFGPSGIFASYFLSLKGFKPIVFERGESIEERVKTVDDFWNKGILNEESNVQFGEGGAGTFSDGKLNTLVKDKYNRMKKVFEIFVENGANEDILYDSKPHIGTDVLRTVVKNIRNKIISLGGEIHFNSKMEDIIIENNKVTGVIVNGKTYETDALILAIGHSARDTFLNLINKNVNIESKPFAIGVRIMHPQKLIDDNQYPINYPFLPPSSYKLTYQTKEGRGVYSFCMCPGGYVVNASSKKGYTVVNGMSYKNRDSGYANSAIIVTVNNNDFGSHQLSGMDLIEKIEKKAYELGNGNILIQRFIDYKNNQISNIEYNELRVKGNVFNANINQIFPDFVNNSLKEGIDYFGTKIKGFNNDDILILGPETRTSSPIKIVRDENLETNIIGVYPCGEGSGYAGGITTSAIDGIKVFEKIIEKYYINY